MRSGSNVQLAALRNRNLELQTTSPFSNHGSVERSKACCRHKNVLHVWIFQKFPIFWVTLYNYAKHLLENQHTLQPIQKCMSILHSTGKGPLLNTLEKFYIYRETLKDNKLSDKNTVASNFIVDAVLRHCGCDTPRFRTY
jgi:hypothetical protein